MGKNIAVFLDRDGTINEEVGYLDCLDKLKIIPAAYEAIRLINKSCMKAIVVTNQAGVARGFFSEEFVRQTHEILQTALQQGKASIDKLEGAITIINDYKWTFKFIRDTAKIFTMHVNEIY